MPWDVIHCLLSLCISLDEGQGTGQLMVGWIDCAAAASRHHKRMAAFIKAIFGFSLSLTSTLYLLLHAS